MSQTTPDSPGTYRLDDDDRFLGKQARQVDRESGPLYTSQAVDAR